MPKKSKHRRKKYKKRSIKNSIYKSNINKQSVKVNVNAGSAPGSSGVKYMNTPSYPNIMDIHSTVKGTVEELLKNINSKHLQIYQLLLLIIH